MFKRLMLRWRLSAHRRASTPEFDCVLTVIAAPFIAGQLWYKIITPAWMTVLAITGEIPW